MISLFETYSAPQLVWLLMSMFLLGMAKGGFPIGPIALPLLVLIWPAEDGGSRKMIAVMLPVLCTMDLFALTFYRKHIQWQRIVPLLPGAVLGVALVSWLFFCRTAPLAALSHHSETLLKLMIGTIGILFVLYQLFRRVILNRLGHARPGWSKSTGFGFTAGITSTIGHAAGPVAQMYFLPQDLSKMELAATHAGFFLILNLVKMVPFTVYGQFKGDVLQLVLLALPVVPFGVAAGYLCVRITKGHAYRLFIYVVLFLTSVTLIITALRDVGSRSAGPVEHNDAGTREGH